MLVSAHVEMTQNLEFRQQVGTSEWHNHHAHIHPMHIICFQPHMTIASNTHQPCRPQSQFSEISPGQNRECFGKAGLSGGKDLDQLQVR